MELSLPPGYRSRPYRGADDHEAMATILSAARRAASDNEFPTAESIGVTYATFPPADCLPERDAALVLTDDGEPVGYARTGREAFANGDVTWLCFPVLHPDHEHRELVVSIVRSMEGHLGEVELEGAQPAWFLTFTPHPGPGLPAEGRSAWLESLGYAGFQFGATLVRPHLDGIPDLALPEGLEVRPVRPEDVRPILEAHHEDFRGQWDFQELGEQAYRRFLDDPSVDTSLWQIAWSGDEVIGQVKTFVNHAENASEGRLRGYTEYISTRADWRGKGVAAALICASLRDLRRRGFTEAALRADVNNPAAFGLYLRLGYEVTSYDAVYRKPIV